MPNETTLIFGISLRFLFMLWSFIPIRYFGVLRGEHRAVLGTDGSPGKCTVQAKIERGGQQGGFDSKRYDTTLLGGSSMVARAVEQPAE